MQITVEVIWFSVFVFYWFDISVPKFLCQSGQWGFRIKGWNALEEILWLWFDKHV